MSGETGEPEPLDRAGAPEDSPERLEEELDEITSWPFGMPVRTMEDVLALGADAVPAIAAALAREEDDEARDVLWLIVLLGEMGDASAVEPLVRQLRRTEWHVTALAAAEALAKIGGEAVPALADVAGTGTAAERLYSYAALGWIRDDAAYAELLQALDRDPELLDVIARAIADHDRPEAIPALYDAYRRCPEEHRAAIADAIWELHHDERPEPLWMLDWRERYRRAPEDGGAIELEWPVIAAILRESAEPRPPAPPLQSLEEILAQEREVEEDETCEECGGPIAEPTGVPVCPETAVSTVAAQIHMVEDAARNGQLDVFDLWDIIEEEHWQLVEEGEPEGRKAKARWHDALTGAELGSLTCRWLVGQGMEWLEDAVPFLRERGAELAEQYGDPDGLLGRTAPVRRQKVGRNDPCPCGSGRKYKRCCIDAP